MLIQVAILVGSIVALYFGAELALEAAEKIGRYFGLSPLVIGLLLIGFGTSLPEFFVSQLASYHDTPGIALGNIVGSNIANLFLILGVAGLMTSLHIMRYEIKHQLVLHVALTAILIGVLYYGKINWMTTGILFSFFGFYLWDTFREMKKQRQLRHVHDEEDQDEVAELSMVVMAKLFFGFALLYFGGEYLVSSSSFLAKVMGVSEYAVSAIFVAFGTSFPELVTAVMACVKKKNTDLITGNIIGSNIFNVAFVMGSIGPYEITVTEAFRMEMLVLGLAALFLMSLAFLKQNFTWPSSLLFLASYGFVIFHWIR